MDILFYGAGVIGSIYASKLSDVGYNVSMLARGQRYDQLVSGIVLEDGLTGAISSSKVTLVRKLEDDDRYDLIVVAVRREQIDEILPILKRNKSRHILIMVNTASGYSNWINQVGAERLLVGFPAAGGFIKDNGNVHSVIMAGLKQVMQKTTIGSVQPHGEFKAKEIVGVFSRSGFPAAYCHNMDAWQKTHVALLSPLANSLFKFDGDLKALAASRYDVEKFIVAVKEGFKVLSQLGYPVTPFGLKFLFTLPVFVLAPIWMRMLGSRFYEAAFNLKANDSWDELKMLGDEFQRLALESGISTDAIDELQSTI